MIVIAAPGSKRSRGSLGGLLVGGGVQTTRLTLQHYLTRLADIKLIVSFVKEHLLFKTPTQAKGGPLEEQLCLHQTDDPVEARAGGSMYS